MKKTLRTLTDDFAEMEEADEKTIDYASVGLYLTGLQVASTIVLCSCASVLSCWILPPDAISAVRTLAICTVIGLVCVRKPVRIGKTRGVSTIFNALRPSVAIYILSLVLQQLVHTCVPKEEEQNTLLRRVVYHSMATIMIVAAFARARSPKSESDIPFLMTGLCAMIIALLPPPAFMHAGPLCEPATLWQAGERLLRAFFFSLAYITHVYAAAPGRNVSNELFICVARASAASVWVLCASAWMLPFAPLQIATVLFSRLGDADCVEPVATEDTYSSVPLNGAPLDRCHDDHICIGGNLSDLEAGDSSSVSSLSGVTGTGCSDFLAATPKLPSLTSVPRGTACVPRQNGLSFQFGNAAPQTATVNMAAVIARETRSDM